MLRAVRALLPVLIIGSCYSGPQRTDPVTKRTYHSPIGNDYQSQLKYVRENYLTVNYLVQDNGELPEPEIFAACNALFTRVGNAVPPEHRRGFPYKLYLTAASSVNAYTYGAGRIHLHLGLVAQCRDAAELAGVLAHEIGHNSHDHIGQSVGRSAQVDNIIGLGGILGRPGRTLTGIVVGPWAGLALVQHSREDEREADDRAVDYAVAAGIDPDGVARFFGRMEGAHGLPLFQTHPSPKNRVQEIRARIRNQHGGGPKDPLVNTPEFERALARAKRIVPYYARLERALTSEDNARVVAACDAGIADLPKHPQFHFWKGVALAAEEKPAEALPYLRVAAELDKTNVVIPFMHCLTELQGGRADLCEQSATRAIEMMPVLPQPWFARGAARIAMKRPSEAHSDFDEGLKRLGRRDRARAIERLKEIDPSYEPKVG